MGWNLRTGLADPSSKGIDLRNMKIMQIDGAESNLVVDLFDKYRVFYRQPSDPGLAQRFIQARLDNHESMIFAALVQHGGDVIPVGFVQLYPGYSSVGAFKYWILNDLYVEPAYRKQKIGEALVRIALDFARGREARFVELSTGVDNFIAQGLYERVGFKKRAQDESFLTYRMEMGETAK